MTWLLQVLDTHGFRSYKNCLREAYQLHWIRHGEQLADVNKLPMVLGSLRDATKVEFYTKEWGYAFARNGFGVSQGGLRPRIRTTLTLDEFFSVTAQWPLPEQVKVCLPKNAFKFYNTIWRAMEPAPVPTGVPNLAHTMAGHSSFSSSSSHASIAARTRAKVKAAPHLSDISGAHRKPL